jgi:hypothetical protein
MHGGNMYIHVGPKVDLLHISWTTKSSPPNQLDPWLQNPWSRWFLCNHFIPPHALHCASALSSPGPAVWPFHACNACCLFRQDMLITGRDLLGKLFEWTDPQLMDLIPGLMESRVHAWAPSTLAGHATAWSDFCCLGQQPSATSLHIPRTKRARWSLFIRHLRRVSLRLNRTRPPEFSKPVLPQPATIYM